MSSDAPHGGVHDSGGTSMDIKARLVGAAFGSLLAMGIGSAGLAFAQGADDAATTTTTPAAEEPAPTTEAPAAEEPAAEPEEPAADDDAADDGVAPEDCEDGGPRGRGPAASGDDASGAGTGTATSIQL